MKILHTSDLHLGRNYTKYESAVAERYKNARLEALKNVVDTANAEKCDYIVIAGDLYDKRSHIPEPLHKEVCKLLGDFDGTVFVLPGNHDFYVDKNDELWSNFSSCSADNTVLLCESRPDERENAVLYPCICNDKYSESNALGWVKENAERSADKLNIGIAHGAIEGLSYDKEQRYYFMTAGELEECKMDLWLIGHTHVPYPNKNEISGERIFNAGTHQQTDISDSSEGSVFVIEIDKANVTARKIHTGVIAFIENNINLAHGESLEEKINSVAQGLDKANTTLRLNISGIALADEYERRAEIYEKFKKEFLNFEHFDSELQPEITADMIDRETLDGSIENKLLKLYIDEPETLNLAFQLVKKCKEAGK